MRDPSPRAPFDQGLFLTHFNKGKSLYEAKHLEEAERELEEAYLLRPRDQNVLNLLGLVYFRQEKLEKAEEVYRKLAAQSPDAPVLFHNLGLIHFKLGHLDEAESAFLKALELSGENPKLNFYLGSIYERLHRFQDAIYQYRQAGASLMVRRVEDKIAASGPGSGTRVRRRDDTAEFKTRDIKEAFRIRQTGDTLPPAGKPLQPVSDALLAQDAPGRTESTAPQVPPESRRRAEPARFPEIITFASGAAADATAAPAPRLRRATDVFRFLENNLMEINVSGRVFIKQGTIYSYGGNLTFWVKDRRPGGHTALVMITGQGKVIVTDRDRDISFLRIEEELLYVEPGHLLACEETLTPRYAVVSEGPGGLEFLALEGSGMVALSVASKPLAMEVTPELPVSVSAAAIICWQGALRPLLVEDKQIYEVLRPSREKVTLIRLEGSGRLLMEQHTP